MKMRSLRTVRCHFNCLKSYEWTPGSTTTGILQALVEIGWIQRRGEWHCPKHLKWEECRACERLEKKAFKKALAKA